jgi:hypothetical protein
MIRPTLIRIDRVNRSNISADMLFARPWRTR